jgi:intracellular septation protein
MKFLYYFHDPLFVKWKPTVIYWIFSVVLLLSQFIGKKPIMQRLLEKMMEGNALIPDGVWRKLNAAWMVFFAILGGVNLYVAYNFSTDAWVNFKLYGTLGALIGFSVLQAIYLARYMSESK